MKKVIAFSIPFIFFLACISQNDKESSANKESEIQRTIVEIRGNQFLINEEVTYKGRFWMGNKIEGLLLNSRMVQGIFDDYNEETRTKWKYPDSQKWDPDRNTSEFVDAMVDWRSHGLLAFTLNLQGGSPMGYGNQGWYNSSYTEKGELRSEYIDRLTKILDKADEIGMVVILGYFYFGQDQNLENEDAVITATRNITNWILDKGYKNILVEINNECDVDAYDHEILMPQRVHELIELVKSMEREGYRLLTSTSFGGNAIPTLNVVEVSDFILIHGNGVDDPARITEMIQQTRDLAAYKEMPVLFNEDDHYEFDKESNNMVAAIRSYASWGFFDFRRDGEQYNDGFQSLPVDWKISSDRKRAFFNKVKEITGM